MIRIDNHNLQRGWRELIRSQHEQESFEASACRWIDKLYSNLQLKKSQFSTDESFLVEKMIPSTLDSDPSADMEWADVARPQRAGDLVRDGQNRRDPPFQGHKYHLRSPKRVATLNRHHCENDGDLFLCRFEPDPSCNNLSEFQKKPPKAKSMVGLRGQDRSGGGGGGF